MKDMTEKEQIQETAEPQVIQDEQYASKGKKSPRIFILVGVFLLVLVGGFFLVRMILPSSAESKTPITEDEYVEEELVPLDEDIKVSLTKSTTKDNSVVIIVTGLDGKYISIGYELQYESAGVGKGVTSGSKPLDVAGKDMFERDIYLGTCSKNVCKPDLGVTSVSLVLEFVNTEGKKSQFSQDFTL